MSPSQPVSSLMCIVKFSSHDSGMDDSYHKEQGKNVKKLYNYISVQKRLKPKVCLSPWSRNESASRARLPYTHQHCSQMQAGQIMQEALTLLNC